jgi:hypothetical protein
LARRATADDIVTRLRVVQRAWLRGQLAGKGNGVLSAGPIASKVDQGVGGVASGESDDITAYLLDDP